MKGCRLLFFALLLGGLMVTSKTVAQPLPPCDTYCNCTRGCYVLNCQVNGFALSCGDWGICQFSCYCGGDCSTYGGGSAAAAIAAPVTKSPVRSAGTCAPSPADTLLASIFGRAPE